MRLLLGIDKGTTMTKAVVFDADTGAAVATARRPTPSFHPHADWHEEDMASTWAGVAAAIRDAITATGRPASEIAGVGVSGHMGGLWALDRHRQPVGRAIAWPDGRACGLLDGWQRDGTVDRLYDICGNAPIPGLPLVLLAHMKRHEPAFFDGIQHLMLAKDYVNYRLTGELVTDESDLSFFPCDIRERRFSPALFELAGVPEAEAWLPAVLPTGAALGRVTREAAAATGLVEGTPVSTGAGDAVAAAIGVGALEAGQAVTVIGTSFMNNLTTDRPLLEPRGVGFLFLMPDGRWQRLMSNTGGGSLCLKWVLDTFGARWGAEGKPDEDALYARIEAEARGLPPLPAGLVFHPYLNTSGMSAPRFEPCARASIFGLDLSVTPIALLRSVMEGVALAMVDCYGAIDAPVRDIRLTGGGARSALWREICAAAMNRPLQIPEVEETGALGVAMLAATAVGLYADLPAAARGMVRFGPAVEPQPRLAEAYAAAYPLFRSLREQMTPLWAQRAALLASTTHRLP
ncbi:MAG: carbohydrate kinase [Rhizobacter sp.]|nr:carbohydrate kinase [Rhizobacter sp.]